MADEKQLRIMIIAGEASGDKHGAKLVNALCSTRNDIVFYGVGGDHMRAAGVDTQYDLSRHAVIGISDAFAHLHTYYQLYQSFVASIKRNPPDLLLLIDSPEFNLRLAKKVKPLGVKILYYISPQIWAWRPWRIHLIKRCIDQMAVILPFEKNIYEAAGVPVTYTGHPLSSVVKPSRSLEQLQAEFKLDANKRTIGLMPGSRNKEITRLLPTFIAAAKQLNEEYSDLQFILPLANEQQIEFVNRALATTTLPIHCVIDRTYDAVSCCHSVMVCSGTATLEVCLLKKPMVIVYKTSFLTLLVAGLLLKAPFIGLPNILAKKEIVPELLLHHARPSVLAKKMKQLLGDQAYYDQMQRQLNDVADSLAQENQDHALMDLVLDMVAGADTVVRVAEAASSVA